MANSAKVVLNELGRARQPGGYLIGFKPLSVTLDTNLPAAPSVPQEHAELISGYMQLRLRYEQDVASQLPVLAALKLQIEAQARRYLELQAARREVQRAQRGAGARAQLRQGRVVYLCGAALEAQVLP